MDTLHVYGDSRVLIEGMTSNINFCAPYLQRWIYQILLLRQCFNYITFQHIFGEANLIADSLSKHGLLTNSSSLFFSLLESNHIRESGSFPLPWTLVIWTFIYYYLLRSLCWIFCFSWRTFKVLTEHDMGIYGVFFLNFLIGVHDGHGQFQSALFCICLSYENIFPC